MKRKILMARKKAKVNVNIDCYSLIKRSVKSQGKVREFLTFWCMSGDPGHYYFYFYFYHYYIMGDKLVQC